jgi:hypothetical protein
VPASRDEARANAARPPAAPAAAPAATPAPRRDLPPPPPAPAPALGKVQRQGAAASSFAVPPAPAAPAEGRAGDSKPESKAPPTRAVAAAPDTGSLEGAAGQQLRQIEEEKEVAEAAPPAEGARKKEGPRAASGVGLRDQDALRRSWPPEALRYRALISEKPESAEGARRVREQWRAFLELSPLPRQADEARVRIVEMGALAWRFSNDPADRDQARRDALAYLRRDDAAQGARVRSLLATLGN